MNKNEKCHILDLCNQFPSSLTLIVTQAVFTTVPLRRMCINDLCFDWLTSMYRCVLH